ncbi:NUDIX hydrolase [Clostridium tarantellae]|uniref:NUDIX domain-containing protein n=1 Tax=Clostridium tarantellae TaxID=39493 RepID=A0A6I1MIT5_9CLOT|nr:CoA pyrophosphatase [Clostridium tarantellae]MPQ43285.1 NUDIX domain-containing protein [Clostridium tarantellae]
MYNTLNKFKNYTPYINGADNLLKAAILIPIVKKNNKLFVLFEMRSKLLKRQPSEVSFPGGIIEKNESPKDAAIRETYEELGVSINDINIICELDLFIDSSSLIIHPFLSIISNINNLNLNKSEVDHIFLIPLDYLLNYKPECYKNEIITIRSKDFPYDLIANKENYMNKKSYCTSIFYKYDKYIIWGMTAKILENFLIQFSKFSI